MSLAILRDSKKNGMTFSNGKYRITARSERHSYEFWEKYDSEQV